MKEEEGERSQTCKARMRGGEFDGNTTWFHYSFTESCGKRQSQSQLERNESDERFKHIPMHPSSISSALTTDRSTFNSSIRGILHTYALKSSEPAA